MNLLFYIDMKGKLHDIDPIIKSALKRAARRAEIVEKARLLLEHGKPGVDYYI